MTDEVIVVEGSRLKIGFAVLLAVGIGAFLAFCAWAIVADFHLWPPSPYPSRRAWLRPLMPFLLTALSLVCGYLAVRGGQAWRTPPCLEIGPAGFTQFVRGKTESWRWDQAESFRLAGDGQLTQVQFDDYRPLAGAEGRPQKPRTTTILGAYSLSARGLLRLMIDRRARWASPPLAPKPPSD